jgi:hypothetical protein
VTVSRRVAGGAGRFSGMNSTGPGAIAFMALRWPQQRCGARVGLVLTG